MEEFSLKGKTIFDFDKGKITSLGGEMGLVHISFLHDLMERMERSFSSTVWDIFYENSKRSAIQHAYKFFKSEYVSKFLTNNDLIAEQVMKIIMQVVQEYGYGVASVSMNSLPEGEALVELKNSSIAEFILKRKGASSRPTCIFMSGFLAGFATVLYGVNLDCDEEKCIAMESDVCSFRIFQSKDKFQKVFMKNKETRVSR